MFDFKFEGKHYAVVNKMEWNLRLQALELKLEVQKTQAIKK